MKTVLYLLARIITLNLIILILWGSFGLIISYINTSHLTLEHYPTPSALLSVFLCNMAYLVGTALAFLNNKWWNKGETLKQIERPYYKGALVLLFILISATIVMV